MPSKHKPPREAPVKRQKGLCAYCGKQFTDELPATAEHVVPKSKGGTSAFRNIIAVCSPCNAERGNEPFPCQIVQTMNTTLAERLMKVLPHLSR